MKMKIAGIKQYMYQTIGKTIGFVILEVFLFVFTLRIDSSQAQVSINTEKSYLAPSVNISRQVFREAYELSFSYSRSADILNREYLLPQNQIRKQAILKETIIANFKADDKFSRHDIELILSLSEKLYGQEQFASGEYYFNHVLEVANVLFNQEVQPEVIIAAILHRLNDTQIKELQKNSRLNLRTVLRLMYAFLDISEFPYAKMNLRGRHDIQNVMDMIIQKSEGNIGIIQLVFADKLASIKTASEIEREDFIKEVEDIYGPLAYRLGLSYIGHEFLNESFRLARPNEYFAVLAEIKRKCGMDYEELKGYLQKKETEWKKSLEEFELRHGMTSSRKEPKIVLTARVKKPYEIAMKTEIKGEKRLKDILGVRIVYDCRPEELDALNDFVQENIGIWTVEQTSRLQVTDGPKKELGGIYIKLGNDDTYDSLPYEVQLLTKVFHELRERTKPHWSYKLKQRTAQEFDAEDFKPTGKFESDFKRVYNHVKNTVIVFFSVVEHGEIVAVKPKRITKGAISADVAALRSVDKLGPDYTGAVIYTYIKGELVRKKEVSNTNTYELKSGDIVEISNGNTGLSYSTKDLLELRRHAKNLRTQLMISLIDLKKIASKDKQERTKPLPAEVSLKEEFKRFGMSGSLDFLYSYARNLGLENVKELYMALTYCSQTVSVSEIVESVKERGKKNLAGDFNLENTNDIFRLGQIASERGIDSLEKFYVWVGAGLVTLDEIRIQKNRLEKSSLSVPSASAGKNFSFKIVLAVEGEKQQVIDGIVKKVENALIREGLDTDAIKISTLGGTINFTAKGIDPLKPGQLKRAILAIKNVTSVNYEEIFDSGKKALRLLEGEIKVKEKGEKVGSLIKRAYNRLGDVEKFETVMVSADNGELLLKITATVRTALSESEFIAKLRDSGIIVRKLSIIEKREITPILNYSEIETAI